ncbi:cytochrome bd-I oxidase subunit CydX [Sodalis sp. RH21]
MWYFAWILGTLLACAFGIITALALEHHEDSRIDGQSVENDLK